MEGEPEMGISGSPNRPSIVPKDHKKLEEKSMSRAHRTLTVFVLIISGTLSLMAQSNPGGVVPRLVNYSGKAVDAQGKTFTGVVGVTFAIYKDQTDGAPLWLETQNVQADAKGNYSVQLGATKSEGMALDLFSSGEARWLGVRVNGGEEQPRVLLLSVPYALKAADADTLGGLPASAFVQNAPIANSTTITTTPGGTTTARPLATGTTPVTTAGGTTNKLAKFDAKADITNSIIFDNGTNVGIGNSAPAAKLDVSGAGIFRGALTLPAIANATASAGKDSQSLNFTASAFNSGTAAAVNQNFRWQAEAAANDTASPSGTLNFLAGSGTGTPKETGLKIAETGIITFAAGQTFPGGGGGGVTSVGLSAPTSDFTVSGSPVTSSGTLGLNWKVAPTNAATANAIVKRDSTGSFSAGAITASLGVTGTSSAVGVYGESTGTASGDNGVQGVTLAGPGSGVAGFNNSGAAGGIGVYGQGDTGMYAYGNTTGVYGHGASYGFATDGNVQQARTAGGWVKAMVVIQGVKAPYTIPNCFNSTLGGAAATTPPCGFTLAEVQPGEFTVGLGFEVDDRFISATLECCFSYGVAPIYASPSGSNLTVFTWDGSNSQPYQASVLIY
jgi:hypothetical protein